MVIPHGHSTPAGLHFSLAQSPLLTPIQEYLVKWNATNQHFLANPVTPQHGEFALPTLPGLGMDLESDKGRGAGGGLRLIAYADVSRIVGACSHRTTGRRHVRARTGFACRVHPMARCNATSFLDSGFGIQK
jgi:hypothetical protein